MGDSGNVLPFKRRNLKSVAAVRKYIADVINRVESGEIDLERARVLGYLVQTLKPFVEAVSLEKRLKEFERSQKNGPTGIVK